MAWAKLLFLRDIGETEVGGFGICPTDPLLVEDVQLVKQTCTWSTVSFDDESVADFFEDQVERGLEPDRFARIWIHTHPGDCAHPSHTDEETLTRVFGSTDWAVMFILACGGETYARMRIGGIEDEELETTVDFTVPFSESEFELWQEEYIHNVFVVPSAGLWDEEFWYLQDEFEADLWESTSELNPIEEDNQLLQLTMEEEYHHDYYPDGGIGPVSASTRLGLD